MSIQHNSLPQWIFIITGRSCGKVMFSVMNFCLQASYHIGTHPTSGHVQTCPAGNSVLYCQSNTTCVHRIFPIFHPSALELNPQMIELSYIHFLPLLEKFRKPSPHSSSHTAKMAQCKIRPISVKSAINDVYAKSFDMLFPVERKMNLTDI